MNFSSDNTRVEHPLTQPITDIQSMIDRECDGKDPTEASSTEVNSEAAAGASDVASAEQAISFTTSLTLEEGVRDDANALHGRYLLEKVIAVGGSSIIYEALDLRSTGSPRQVALKTLRPELKSNAHAIERLKREFRYAAAAAHPHTVRMFDLEKVGSTWCITMELLTGASLATKLYELKPECVSTKQALAVLKACSRALNAAHQRGIVHCDFKPSNVWVTSLRDTRTDVRVLDFGAAHRYAIRSKDAPPKSMWLTGEPLLPATVTPAYASPQMLTGEPPDPRDDVFSFACVAYEILTGRHPFGRLNAVEMMATGQTLRRPIGLSFKRWHALQRGLAWQRELRTPTVPSLMLELDQFPHAGGSQNSLVLEQWALRAADWFAAKGLLGESRVREAPDYIRISSIRSRHLALLRPERQKLAAVAKVAHQVNRFSIVVVDEIINGLRWLFVLAVKATLSVQNRARTAKSLPAIKKARVELKATAAKLKLTGARIKDWVEADKLAEEQVASRAAQSEADAATAARVEAQPEPVKSRTSVWRDSLGSKFAAITLAIQAQWRKSYSASAGIPARRAPKQRAAEIGLRPARYLSGIGLALLVIAAVSFLMQQYSQHDLQQGAQSSEVAADLSNRTPMVTASSTATGPRLFGDHPTEEFMMNYRGSSDMKPTVEMLRVNRLLQPATDWRDDRVAKSGDTLSGNAFAFSSQAKSGVKPAQILPANRPTNSVTLAHSRIDVSDQAVAAVLLLQRAGRVNEPVTVRWRTVVGSAKPGADYEAVASGTARFADNQTVRTLYVPLKQNAKNSIGQASRSFEVELSSPSRGAELGKITRAVITIHRRES